MSGDLYQQDALIWSEQQAEPPRRLSLGERVNEQVDWPHVIEELRDVGLWELRACRSLLRRAPIHLLKAHAWPAGPVEHWLGEAATLLDDTRSGLSPSMRGRLDLAELYDDAWRRVAKTRVDGRVPPDLPATCPWDLADLLDRDVDPAALVARLDRPAG